jgi:hypothetical protein
VLHTAPAQHDAAADYDAFLEKLPKDDCVWGVYDFEFTKGDEGKRNKICFISWCVRVCSRKGGGMYGGWQGDEGYGRSMLAGCVVRAQQRLWHIAPATVLPSCIRMLCTSPSAVSHLAHCASLTPSRRVQGAG